MKKTVMATVSVHGFHRWPQAPQDVAYLAKQHRHLFVIKVSAPISRDRDVEYHRLQRWIREGLENIYKPICVGEYDFGTHSCETIAENLLGWLKHLGATTVEVWEDGENGSRVEL